MKNPANAAGLNHPSSHRMTEVAAGLTTFLTMSYIVVVNPSILATEGTGMPFSGVLSATVILSALMTLLMGLYARLPFAVAPGMGINAFFAFSLVLGQKIPWPVALGMVFWAGVFFLVISFTRLRESIAQAIPPQLRIAAACGIGIFLTFIGLKNMGLVVADPATFVKLGHIGLPQVISLLGLAFSVWLSRKRSPLAFLGGIALITGLAYALGLAKPPAEIFSKPDFGSVLFKADPMGALHLAYLPAILSILFTDLFDSISTFVGVAHATGLTDEKGEPLRLREGLRVDAIATFGASLLGTSPGTAYIESASGIEAGGRTGLTSVVTGLCFLPCLFLAPLAGAIPPYATAPILVLVGALMFRTVTSLKLEKLEDTLPAFLTLTLIPLTFSITQGILWGFLSHTVLYAISGRWKEIHPAMVALATLSVLLIWIA